MSLQTERALKTDQNLGKWTAQTRVILPKRRAKKWISMWGWTRSWTICTPVCKSNAHPCAEGCNIDTLRTCQDELFQMSNWTGRPKVRKHGGMAQSVEHTGRVSNKVTFTCINLKKLARIMGGNPSLSGTFRRFLQLLLDFLVRQNKIAPAFVRWNHFVYDLWLRDFRVALLAVIPSFRFS